MKEEKEYTASVKLVPHSDYEHRMRKVVEILLEETLEAERKNNS